MIITADTTLTGAHETRENLDVFSEVPVDITFETPSPNNAVRITQKGYGKVSCVGAGVKFIAPPGYLPNTRLPGDVMTCTPLYPSVVRVEGDLMEDNILSEALFRMSGQHNRTFGTNGIDGEEWPLAEWWCSNGTGNRFRNENQGSIRPIASNSATGITNTSTIPEFVRMKDTAGTFAELYAQGAISTVTDDVTFMVAGHCGLNGVAQNLVYADSNTWLSVEVYPSVGDAVRMYHSGGAKDYAGGKVIHSAGAPFVVGCSANGTAGGLWVHGVHTTTATLTPIDWVNLRCSALVSSMFYYELICWDRALTPAEFAEADGMLALGLGIDTA